MKLKSSERLSPELNDIFSPQTIRKKAAEVFSHIKSGKGHFQYNEDKWPFVVEHVISTIKENYPSLEIPFHARYVHFRAGGHDRLKLQEEYLNSLDGVERARTLIELVITSVLLDAGAGPTWKYSEEQTGETYNRSEGLGVASFHMFFNGSFSEDGSNIATGEGLKNLTEDKLKKDFQVTDANPLVGVSGRVQLLQNLGKVVLENEEFFPNKRLGGLVDFFLKEYGTVLPAEELLKTLLVSLGAIWPGRLEKEGKNLGDVWNYPPLNTLVPFHKLSQWLSYSLIEPLGEAGIKIQGMEQLTGLPEYRNGGLFVDSGLIELRNGEEYEKAWRPDSELIVEWRALTICLLDECAQRVREKMNITEKDFPLVKVLEGGTWWAGRRLASGKRNDGSPPIKIESDGTVF